MLRPCPWAAFLWVFFIYFFNEGGAAATQAPRRPGDILQTRSSSRPTRPDRLALSGDFDVIKNTQTHKKHSLWCGGCSSCPGSQTSRRWFRLSRCVVNRYQCDGMLPDYRDEDNGNDEEEEAEEEEIAGFKLSSGGHKMEIKVVSELRFASWQPPGLRRCTKPSFIIFFLPRRSETEREEEGGTAREPSSQWKDTTAHARSLAPAPLTGKSH